MWLDWWCAIRLKNALLKQGNKSDRIDAGKLAELLGGNYLKTVYHGQTEVRTPITMPPLPCQF